MAIRLPADVEAGIRQKVESSHFADAGEVVREAMRLLEDQERLFATLREKLRVGLDQVDRGESVERTSELRQRIRESARQRARSGETSDPDVCP